MAPLQQEEIQQNVNKTLQFRKFAGVNMTDTRTSIGDEEFAWLENAIPVGAGNLRLVPGIGAAISGAPLTTIATSWGFTLAGNPVLIVVGTDGSLVQVRADTGAKTVIAVAGTVTTACRLTIWQDSPVLLIDPVKGYMKWDGTTFTVISASRLGSAIAIFAGRAWIVGVQPSRTITFTSPATFDDFNPANGSGSVTISDSVFIGPITNLISALEQLWIVGSGAVNALTNVSTSGSPLTTTFSITNVVSNVGSTFPSSLSAFFRTILFLTPYGVYAIVGATPQKLSDKLDGLFPDLALGADASAAVGTVHSVFIWAILTTFNDPALGPRPLLLCFSQGKWFFASAGAITWITSVIVGGQPQIWAAIGATVRPLFADATVSVDYRLTFKLFDFGDSTQMKGWNHLGLEFQSSNVIAPAITLENEIEGLGAVVNVVPQNTLTFVGSGPITFVGSGSIVWVGSGLQLVRAAAAIQMFGNYLGLTIEGTEPVWTLSALAMEIRPGGKWNRLRN